jgi:hypothetical protein
VLSGHSRPLDLFLLTQESWISFLSFSAIVLRAAVLSLLVIALLEKVEGYMGTRLAATVKLSSTGIARRIIATATARDAMEINQEIQARRAEGLRLVYASAWGQASSSAS